MSEGTLPNEEAAEHRTNISGWVCKTCRRFYGDEEGAERTARYCCEKDHECGTEGCNGRAGKPWIYCDPCIKKRADARWAGLEQVAWDGDTPLVLFDDDHYFFDVDDLEYFLDEEGLTLEKIQLVIAEEDRKPRFDIQEFLCDYLPEGEDVDGAEKLDKFVNRWIGNNVPSSWVPSKKRPTLVSLKQYVKEPEPEKKD